MNVNAPSANAFYRGAFFVARETAETFKDDPALALRASATLLQSPVLDGVSDGIRSSTGTAIIPVIRTALLATNTVQAVKTFQRADANWMDKGMDSLRVATDLVGAVGALAMVFTPKYAQLGLQLVGTAYAADLVSHAYRGITHMNKRVHVWEQELNANQNPPATPPTPPAGNAPKTLSMETPPAVGAAPSAKKD